MKLLFLLSLALSSFATTRLDTVPGVDCSGSSDSAPALNTLFTSISGKQVVIPEGCTLRADSQLVIFGQTDFSIEGEGFQPNQVSHGPFIFGCGGSGPVLFINRSSYYELRNFGVIAKGNNCSSSFTGSIAWANIGGGGFTSTVANLRGMALSSSTNGTKISGYFGVGVGINSAGQPGQGGPNLEQFSIQDSWVHCQDSQGSYGLWIAGSNADNGEASRNKIGHCFHGIQQVTGNLKTVSSNQFANNGNFSIFGAHGASVFLSGCVSGGMNYLSNEFSDGGPIINQNNDQAQGGIGCPMNWVGNVFGVNDIAPAEYPMNLGAAPGHYVLIGNQFNFTGTTSATMIGSSSQTSCAWGPLGDLVDISNFTNWQPRTGGWTGCVSAPDVIVPFQSGEFHQMSPLGERALVVEGGAYATRHSSLAPAYPSVSDIDPGCTRVGSTWFDTGWGAASTGYKVCLKVAGVLQWVAK